jgi:hypothetical protein
MHTDRRKMLGLMQRLFAAGEAERYAESCWWSTVAGKLFACV